MSKDFPLDSWNLDLGMTPSMGESGTAEDTVNPPRWRKYYCFCNGEKKSVSYSVVNDSLRPCGL